MNDFTLNMTHPQSTLGSVITRFLYLHIQYMKIVKDRSEFTLMTLREKLGKVCIHANKNPRLHDVNGTYLSMMQPGL
jgi:hypothetical protein